MQELVLHCVLVPLMGEVLGEPCAGTVLSKVLELVWGWCGVCSLGCVCRTIEPEALKQGNMSSLGFTSKEQRNLGLLVHLMTSNPKILYAPVGTEVDKVILKVRVAEARCLSIPMRQPCWMGFVRQALCDGRAEQEEAGSCQPVQGWAGTSWLLGVLQQRPGQRVALPPPAASLPSHRPMRPLPSWATSPTMPRCG